MSVAAPIRWLRRARPLLGTLVEVGALAQSPAAAQAAFDAVAEVQALMSRFDPASDVARFNALAGGAALTIDPLTAEVLGAARALHAASGGLFDVSAGRHAAWELHGRQLLKHDADAQLDLGGIAKGYAVDQAVAALQRAGCTGGWVNAGGDARAFGSAELPIWLRDEAQGGLRPFATLADAALATSRYGPHSRCQAWRRDAGRPVRAHVSVAAPRCLWADALTKLVALSGDPGHTLLAQHGARAWLH